jgi:hypothetical protein
MSGISRKADLEQRIRESYSLIRDYEVKIQVEYDPQTKLRWQRQAAEQRDSIRRWLSEYQSLCQRLERSVPDDIAQIAASPEFQRRRPELPVPVPPEPDTQPVEEDGRNRWTRVPWYKCFLAAFPITVVLVLLFARPLRCLLEFRMNRTIAALVITLAGAVAAALRRQLAPHYHTILWGISGGLASALLLGILVHLVLPTPTVEYCYPIDYEFPVTVTPIPTPTWMPTSTSTPTAAPTGTPSPTPTPIPPSTCTPTPTATPTHTPTPTTNQCPTVTLSISPELITPGGTVSLTAQVSDPENDQPVYFWKATAPGLQKEGGPYKSPQNKYIAPLGSWGEQIAITVTVDDRHCGQKIESGKVVLVVLPAPSTSTPTPTRVPMPTPTHTPTSTGTPTPTATPTHTPTSTGTPTPTATPTHTPTSTGTPTPVPTDTHTPTPTATPVYPPIELLEPACGATCSGKSVILRWKPVPKKLEKNQWYDVNLRVILPDGTRDWRLDLGGLADWVKEPKFVFKGREVLCGIKGSHNFEWHVQVVEAQSKGAEKRRYLSPVDQKWTWTFSWYPPPPVPTPTPTEYPQVPTPTEYPPPPKSKGVRSQ